MNTIIISTNAIYLKERFIKLINESLINLIEKEEIEIIITNFIHASITCYIDNDYILLEEVIRCIIDMIDHVYYYAELTIDWNEIYEQLKQFTNEIQMLYYNNGMYSKIALFIDQGFNIDSVLINNPYSMSIVLKQDKNVLK